MSDQYQIVDAKVLAMFAAARHVLGALGTVVGTLGFVNAGTWELITGGAITIGMIVWSIWEKYSVARKVNG